MFINVSNHPSEKWGADQSAAAQAYGPIVDLPFPDIDPRLDREAVLALAQEYYARVCALAPEGTTVMVSGEFTFTYHLVALLLAGGYHPVSACTRREAVETVQPDGSVVKTARFVFVQFREY